MAKETAAVAAMGSMAVAIAFMTQDYAEGEGEDALVVTKGQRLELPQDTFAEMEEAGLCEAGIYVTMLKGVEGGRYSLKPNDKTWLPPYIYEAWKEAGICAPSDEDPSVVATLKAREEAAKVAVAERDAALKANADLEVEIKGLQATLSALETQAHAVFSLVGTALKDKDEVPKYLQDSVDALDVLFQMLPEIADEGENPELGLG